MAQDFAQNAVNGLRKRQEEAYKYHATGMPGYRRVVEWA
jgi:hypothetical protein